MIARIFRPAFTARRSLLVVGTVFAGLVFPAASMAATDQIKTTPIHKGSKGFELTLFFKEGMPTGYGGRFQNSVAAILFKHDKNATENDNYAFSATHSHPLKFKPANKSLQSAKITGTFANGGGSINMTFHGTGKTSKVKVPKRCTGHAGERRSGTLSGSFTLHADHLGTITQKSFKATISTASFSQCTKSSRGYKVQTIGYKPAYISVLKSSTNKVSEEFEVSSNGGGWVFDHTYTVSGLPSSDYSLNTKRLNSGTVKGAGGISGTAKYSSKGSSSRQTTGKMTGSLAVTFASIGKVVAFPTKSGRAANQSHHP